MKNIGAAVLLFAFCSAPSWAQALIISDIVDGDIWQTTIVLTNTTAASANASLSFYEETSAPATQPWNLSFLEVSSTQSITLAAGETLLLHTPGTAASLSQGWGQVVASAGVQAYAIFTKRPLGLPAQVGTSPAAASASGILVPFDNTSGNVAAVAVANTGSTAETIGVNIRTTSGTVTQGTPLTIPAQGHMTFTLPSQFTATAGQSGLAEFYTSSGTFSMLALSFNPAGSLTTAPVYSEAGSPILGGGGGGGGTLPQFNSISINSPNLGISLILVTALQPGTYEGGVEGLAYPGVPGLTAYAAAWNSVTVSGLTLTFTGLAVSASQMAVSGNVADITSASLTVTLTPQVVNTSGTVTGSMTLVSTVGTITGSFTGTYTAQ
jgi:hypothetical protein